MRWSYRPPLQSVIRTAANGGASHVAGDKRGSGVVSIDGTYAVAGIPLAGDRVATKGEGHGSQIDEAKMLSVTI